MEATHLQELFPQVSFALCKAIDKVVQQWHIRNASLMMMPTRVLNV